MTFATLTYSDPDGIHTVALEGETTTLGRSPGQDLVLRDPLVSRRHAVVVRDGETYTVLDQDSTHGTFLNSLRVRQAALRSGDVLQLGSLKGARLRFHMPLSAPPSLPSSEDSSQSSFRVLLTTLQERAMVDRERGLSGHTLVGREMEQLGWLIRAARELNAGGAVEDILGVLLQLTLQLTGVERGFVFLCESPASGSPVFGSPVFGGQDGELSGGERREQAPEQVLRFALGLGAEGPIAEEDSTISRRAMQKAIESERKFSISDTLADDLASEWSSILANRIRSIYCLPLRKPGSGNAPGQLLGVLYLDSQIRPGALTDVDHQLLDTIATEAAALLHNALLAESERQARQAREELAVAARIHSGLMTIRLPELPYAVIRAKSIPCLAIGGDFYDVVALDNCVCVSIVDVSGKGVSAAIVAATLQGILHAQLLARQSLAHTAAMVNHFLCARNVGKYATMVILRLFPDGVLEYLNCGHIAPLVVGAAQPDGGSPRAIRRLEASNLIVGLIAEASYAPGHDRLQPGDRLLLATDGITEAESAEGELFGDEGLKEVAQMVDFSGILDRVMKFQEPNPAQDDCTLLEVHYRI